MCTEILFCLVDLRSVLPSIRARVVIITRVRTRRGAGHYGVRETSQKPQSPSTARETPRGDSKFSQITREKRSVVLARTCPKDNNHIITINVHERLSDAFAVSIVLTLRVGPPSPRRSVCHIRFYAEQCSQ